MYLISAIGVLILIVGIVEFNKAKNKYENALKYNNLDDVGAHSVRPQEGQEKSAKEEIIKENELLSRKITELINQKR